VSVIDRNADNFRQSQYSNSCLSLLLKLSLRLVMWFLQLLLNLTRGQKQIYILENRLIFLSRAHTPHCWPKPVFHAFS